MISSLVAAASFFLAGGPPDQLFDDLKNAPSPEAAQPIEEDIWTSWLEGDSAVVEVIMKRALEAQGAGNLDKALELYDRAIVPDFAHLAGQFHRVKRLGDDVQGTFAAKAVRNVFLDTGGHEDDWHMFHSRELAELTESFLAVHVRHHVIQQEKIRCEIRCLFHRFCAGGTRGLFSMVS